MTPARRPGRGAVRDRILEAAAKVFADNGFAGARIDEIAAAAGFSEGAVYSDFTTKDELFFALMDDQMARRAELVGRVLNQFPPTAETTAAISEQMTEVIVANRDWQPLFLDYWQRALRDEAVRDSFVAHRRAIRQALTEAIERRLAEAAPSSRSHPHNSCSRCWHCPDRATEERVPGQRQRRASNSQPEHNFAPTNRL